MRTFKVGDKVRAKRGWKAIGKITYVGIKDFLVYNVKYPDGNELEFHKGELERVK